MGLTMFCLKYRLSNSPCTMVTTACTAAGTSSGSRLRRVSSTCENNSVTVCSSMGSRSPSAERIVPVAAGREATIFSKTGTIFFTTAWKASTRFCVRFVMSAFALPSPAVNEPRAACKRPMEPLMVWVDSLAKLPACYSVFSKNICMAFSAFSALVALAQVKASPFARA